jgi:homogentisate 1,2-dioxygenase
MHYTSLAAGVRRSGHTAATAADPGFKGEGLFYEEVVTTQGFSRAYSIAYHLRPPTRVKAVEPPGSMPVEVAPQDVLRHHHLKSAALPVRRRPGHRPRAAAHQRGCHALAVQADQPQAELFRNALADEVLFVHKGHGRLLTPFGVLPFRPFDYVVIPRCTTYKLDFERRVRHPTSW